MEQKTFEDTPLSQRTAIEIVGVFDAHRATGEMGIGFGSVRIPPNEEAIRAAIVLQKAARKAALTPMAETGKEGKALADSMEGRAGRVSALGVSEDRFGLSYAITFPTGALSGLPSGATHDVPKPIVRADLVGVEIDDAEGCIDSMGACVEGSTAFLSKFGIDYSQEHDPDSTCCCGCCDDGYDGGAIDYVESFTLTQDMVDAIEAEGYLEQVQEFLDLEPRTWDDFADGSIPLPGVEGETMVGPGWAFAADWETIFEDVDKETILAVMPKIMDLLSAYAAAGKAPPVPGVYSRVDPHSRAGKVQAYWNPDDGTSTDMVDSSAFARFQVQVSGGRFVVLPDGGRIQVRAGDRVTIPFHDVTADDGAAAILSRFDGAEIGLVDVHPARRAW